MVRRFVDDLILVLHPRSMLTKILDFVGLDWDEVVMDHENHMDKVGLSGAERSTDQVFSFLFGTLHENQFFPF